MSIVGLIPAAGHATRLQPLEGSKETIAVGGRRLMDFLVERLRETPCDLIRMTTRGEKHDVIAHARSLGLEVVIAEPASVTESLLAGTAGLADEDHVCFGFPDTVWDPLDGFARLVEELSKGAELVLGLFRGADLERCDVVSLDGGRVAGVEVKPARPRSPWIWGCAAMTTGLLRRMDEAEPGVFFDRVARESPASVRGVRLSDEFHDLGTREALARFLRDDAARSRSGQRKACEKREDLGPGPGLD